MQRQPHGLDEALRQKMLDELAKLLEEKRLALARTKFKTMFPDQGPFRRELYRRHMELFAAGADYRERCFMAANRVGKTTSGAYETSLHLTGDYPEWWPGARFTRPVSAWAAGKTNETTRDIVQSELLGGITFDGARKLLDGTGMVPWEKIDGRSVTWKAGVADLVDSVKVRHKSGGWSRLGLKSYQQGRGSFEGTSKHFIWLDEEPPKDIYDECLVRTATTSGRVLITFTPLEGLSEVVLSFMPAGTAPSS